MCFALMSSRALSPKCDLFLAISLSVFRSSCRSIIPLRTLRWPDVRVRSASRVCLLRDQWSAPGSDAPWLPAAIHAHVLPWISSIGFDACRLYRPMPSHAHLSTSCATPNLIDVSRRTQHTLPRCEPERDRVSPTVTPSPSRGSGRASCRSPRVTPV
ncbi:hypothetical protein L226DRAFT_377722 [Lentinus tigrinus ALCF2SS1-7]|uniref:uncharacterized protein n=1 Tax=Lentinus tigrinus ALCF2SS1-7 TaxID=1328758 RepID=UPI00116604FA|nr:hypothetical protein L226DRAFT_377722 [Lentinus tigrinus ALCF2SS1-7]